jgi:hypothetical protein
MQDFLADWRRWSRAERAAALIFAALLSLAAPAVVAAYAAI